MQHSIPLKYAETLKLAYEGGFERLYNHISTSAFHNSPERLNSPRCHPNTREAVLQKVFEWILASNNRKSWLLWLTGPDGCGKTAIAQSIADACARRRIATISFFFSKADPTRSGTEHLVATFAYQLSGIFPSIKDAILQPINDDPHIFQRPFQSQLDTLIIRPLRQLCAHKSDLLAISSPTPILLMMMDGIDECSHADVQCSIFRALVSILSTENLPVMIIMSSRPQAHLNMTFNEQAVNGLAMRVALDQRYLPENDIRLYLCDYLEKIQRNSGPNTSWPSPPEVDVIVSRSSGQFIYPSVVVNSLLSSHGQSPVERFKVIQGLRPLYGPLSTTSHLDTLYQYIFSQITNLDLVLKILAFVMIGQVDDARWVSQFFGITILDLEKVLRDLQPVLACSERIRFSHVSLQEFLYDPSRSQKYHISRVISSNELAHMWYNNTWLSTSLPEQCVTVVLRFLKLADPTPQLQDDILTFQPERILHSVKPEFLAKFLGVIKSMYFNDDGRAYRRQLRAVTTLIYQNHPDLLPEIRRYHDVDRIIKQLRDEEFDVAGPESAMKPTKRKVGEKVRAALSPRKFSFSIPGPSKRTN